MSNTLVNILRIKELRQRIFYTIGLLIIFRIGAQIPVPGINFAALKDFLASQSGGADPFLEYFNFFSGGAFMNMSMFALGIMPYITTSIIFQLLLLVVPALKRISEEEGGRKKINQYQRMATVVVCFLQSFMTINFINSIPDNVIAVPDAFRPMFYVSTILITTTGTIILMWLGERITENGIGNGISLLIFAGIVARLPSAVSQLFIKVQGGDLDIPVVLFILIMFTIIIGLVIYEQQGQRKIPVNYAKRIVGRKMYGAPSTYLPLKINPSGVIPIIFASSVLIVPQTVGNVFSDNEIIATVVRWLRHDGIPYLVVYSLLIIAFSYFYTQVTHNPIEIAKNIRENGGTIPGIPINKVEEYLTKVLNRIVLPGSLFLAAIAIIPTVIINLIPDFPASFAYLLGGTSLIIIVGVALDTVSQIESHLRMHHQEGLVKKGKIRSRNF
jgi:preprotein translocase subunit SecY